ncbi:unnamed protein product, partial [Urochloa humidicola]
GRPTNNSEKKDEPVGAGEQKATTENTTGVQQQSANQRPNAVRASQAVVPRSRPRTPASR